MLSTVHSILCKLILTCDTQILVVMIVSRLPRPFQHHTNKLSEKFNCLQLKKGQNFKRFYIYVDYQSLRKIPKMNKLYKSPPRLDLLV